MYIGTTSPSNIRGSLVSLQQFLITVSILLSYGINYLLAGAVGAASLVLHATYAPRLLGLRSA